MCVWRSHSVQNNLLRWLTNLSTSHAFGHYVQTYGLRRYILFWFVFICAVLVSRDTTNTHWPTNLVGFTDTKLMASSIHGLYDNPNIYKIRTLKEPHVRRFVYIALPICIYSHAFYKCSNYIVCALFIVTTAALVCLFSLYSKISCAHRRSNARVWWMAAGWREATTSWSHFAIASKQNGVPWQMVVWSAARRDERKTQAQKSAMWTLVEQNQTHKHTHTYQLAADCLPFHGSIGCHCARKVILTERVGLNARCHMRGMCVCLSCLCVVGSANLYGGRDLIYTQKFRRVCVSGVNFMSPLACMTREGVCGWRFDKRHLRLSDPAKHTYGVTRETFVFEWVLFGCNYIRL